MGIEKVKDEVIAKAKKSAAGIIAESQKEAERMINAAEEKAEIRKNTAALETEKELADMKIRELSSAELEAAKMLLNAKKNAIDKVFDEATQRISKMPPSSRKEHINAMVGKAKSQIEIGKLLCSERDIKNIDGYKIQPAGITGGIIAENRDGTVRIDYSYEAIIEKIRREMLKDVAKILFKSE